MEYKNLNIRSFKRFLEFLQLFCFRPLINVKSTNKMLRFQLHLSKRKEKNKQKTAALDYITVIFKAFYVLSLKKKNFNKVYYF